MNNNTRVDRLIKAGVSEEQLEKVGSEFPESQPLLDDLKFVRQESAEQILIPLSKVMYAINRVDEKLSWLDNFIENNEYRQGKDGSFEVLLSSLEKRGKDEFINSFQIDQESPITAIYYEDFDTYVIGEGKHRATFAKVIGMSTIKAKVTTYKSNLLEVRKYSNYKNKLEELKEAIHKNNLFFTCEKAQIGAYKGKKIDIKFGEKSIIKLEVFENYFQDDGKIDLNISVMKEVSNFIKKIKRFPFLKIFFAKLFLDNGKYHQLTKLILNKLIKHEYFK